MSAISGYGAGGQVSQWGSTIKPPRVRTVKSQYRFWYDFNCCQDIKLPTTKQAIIIQAIATHGLISDRGCLPDLYLLHLEPYPPQTDSVALQVLIGTDIYVTDSSPDL